MQALEGRKGAGSELVGKRQKRLPDRIRAELENGFEWTGSSEGPRVLTNYDSKRAFQREVPLCSTSSDPSCGG